MINRVFVFLILIVAAAFKIAGQDKLSKSEIIDRMKDVKFAEAYFPLEASYKKFPKDPDYIYFLGVCKVQLNYDIKAAVDLLNEATQQDTYKESWFYLAKAKFLNYEFTSAGELFNKFGEKASRDQKEKVRFDLHQTMCRNAVDVCSRSKKITVIRVDTVAEKDLFSYLNKHSIGGKLGKTGDPERPSPRKEGMKFSGNNVIFETRYSFGKKQKDVFVSQNEDIELGKPKTIGNPVNTVQEEEFVYYDETVPALYFSSQGHNSAGGYDIFKSYYDKVTQKWSKPVNLGFPVNTPADEIAYVNIPGTKRSLLASKRDAALGKVVVYTLENAEDAPEETIDPVMAMEISKLKVGKQTTFSSGKNFADVKNTPNDKKPVVYKKNAVPAEILDEKSYQKLIHDALNLQIRSDSIKRISDEKKELLLSARSENEKTKLWQEIRTLDSRADEIQQKADVLYKKARQIESEKQEIARRNSEELAKKAFSGKDKQVNAANETSKSKELQQSDIRRDIHEIQYRIQVGVFSKPQPESMFKQFTNLYREDLREGTAFKYYVGLYKKIAEAEKGLMNVKNAGFKDAYIIGFYNGRVVPLSRAKELELTNGSTKK